MRSWHSFRSALQITQRHTDDGLIAIVITHPDYGPLTTARDSNPTRAIPDMLKFLRVCFERLHQ